MAPTAESRSRTSGVLWCFGWAGAAGAAGAGGAGAAGAAGAGAGGAAGGAGVACHFPPFFFSFPNDELMG